MKLKRKASLVAAAPSAAAIPKSARFSSEIISTAGRPAERASTPLRPFEADLADHPASAKHWADPAMSLFAQLEELYPADPGQLSGCSLYINRGRPIYLLKRGNRVRSTEGRLCTQPPPRRSGG